jgi:Dynein heavy chain, N-terminal region 2
VKRLASRVEKVQNELILISETIEQWKECQRNWIYLENVF